MDWLQSILETRNEIKSRRIGNGVDCKGNQKMVEGQVLNGVIRRTAHGYELEADLRHAELIIEQLDLQSCEPVAVPGIDVSVNCAAWDKEPEREELPPADCSRYPANAARCNDLQPDRPEI